MDKAKCSKKTQWVVKEKIEMAANKTSLRLRQLLL